MQMPDGSRSWVDCLTLRCFGPHSRDTQDAGCHPGAGSVAVAWREFRNDEERSRSLIQILGQLHAEGLLNVDS
jgi:hypothetical protein